MIEASAITSGTTARNEANTKPSTISAPKAPIIPSARRLLPPPACASSTS